MKTFLYAVKTNYGYGLFQYLGERYPSNSYRFHIIYTKQIKELNMKEIKESIRGEYYIEKVWNEENKVIKIGKFELPKGAEMPKITRSFSGGLISKSAGWILNDEISHKEIKNEKGKLLVYKTLPDELKNMPRYSTTYIHNLIEDFNTGYRPSDYNDESIEKERQSYYKEQEEMKAKRLEMQKQKEEEKKQKEAEKKSKEEGKRKKEAENKHREEERNKLNK